MHCTGDPDFLIGVANAFYKSNVGTNWICISLWTHKLKDVRFEAPAPVGNISREQDQSSSVKFPHIYGPITKESLIAVYNVVRAEDGTFLRISDIN